jgi:hypothetical protein
MTTITPHSNPAPVVTINISARAIISVLAVIAVVVLVALWATGTFDSSPDMVPLSDDAVGWLRDYPNNVPSNLSPADFDR